MRKVGNMKLYSIDEILDEDLGKIGTPERDKFETELQAEVHAYHIGEAIRNARKEKKLTHLWACNVPRFQRLKVGKISISQRLPKPSRQCKFQQTSLLGTHLWLFGDT